jgi:AraC-like DNA-binding protein
MWPRRALVAHLFRDEYNIKRVAEQLGVHRNTVSADLSTLGLDRFSLISDYDLDELVAGVLIAAHLALGPIALESWLQALGYFIQRDRLRLCRARLGVMGQAPKRIKRLK